MTEEKEIPLGAFDSETIDWTYTIPEGFTAKIDGGKIIVEKKDNVGENIRLGLMALISNWNYPQELFAPRAKILTYLEKLKEFQFDYPGLYFYDGEKLHFQGNPAMEENLHCFSKKYQEEKQKEQKPESGSSEKPNDHAEWSEEDEQMYSRIVRRYTDYEGVIMRTKEESVANKMLDAMAQEEIWLKERLKFLRPQPKAGLTLLDENIIKAAVAFVEQNDHFNCWAGIDKHTIIKALRSIKPHWKPSEEQIHAIVEALKYIPNNKEEWIILENLMNDLKKL